MKTRSSATLVQSSPTTRSWLLILRDRLPQLEYSETKYWAAFKTVPPQKTVAYLDPRQASVRVFLGLIPGSEPDLQPTPSTKGWAARFPSIFQVTDKQDLTEATRLILKSHAAIGPSKQERTTSRPEHFAAEELHPKIQYLEGTTHRILVNAYEGSPRARETCLRHFGRSCTVCGFNFEAKYGKVTAGYIQVHHIVPIAQIDRQYRLDPIKDLRPVCPNCHAVIHRREPPFSVEEVKQMLRNCGGQDSR
jgi:5-methylcytosine-specific restriction endonuclease McrA